MDRKEARYMWIENSTFKEDLEQVVSLTCIPWEKLRKKTIFITGVTGLIGYTVVNVLLYANRKYSLDIHVLGLVRNIKKAEKKYVAQLKNSDQLKFVEGTVETLPTIDEEIHYIIHGASPTASDYFVKNPVETIKIAVSGTMHMLELAKENKVMGFLYLSSMEIYGSPQTEDVLSEKDVGYMDPLIIRNCYPESKRLCESMCAAYASEYGVPAMSVRLSQTFGPGVAQNDKRVFAEFGRSVMNHKDIVLLTDGSSKRCYLYTMDAASAILTVLLQGMPGSVYNAGNPDTYCSVYEMAVMVAEKLAGNKIRVILAGDKEQRKKFPPPHFYNLGIEKISQLGWKPFKGLADMYESMMENMRES